MLHALSDEFIFSSHIQPGIVCTECSYKYLTFSVFNFKVFLCFTFFGGGASGGSDDMLKRRPFRTHVHSAGRSENMRDGF